MAGEGDVEKKKIPADTQVFKWNYTTQQRAGLEWTEGRDLVIAQVGVYKPEEYEQEATPTSYIAITETKRESKWESKPDASKTILALMGQFDADGHFAVSETKYMKDHATAGFEGWCVVKLKLVNSTGGAIQLKDEDGHATGAIDVVLPAMDFHDDAWSLDVIFSMKSYPEKKQDQVWLRGEIKPLLKAPAKYSDKRFEGANEKYAAWASAYTRKSYDKVFIHCTCAKNQPLDKWFDFEPIAKIYSDYGFGAPFVIGRDGTIYHCVRNWRPCRHAPPENTKSIGVELAGMVDDLAVPMQVSWTIAHLAKKPIATSAGTLSATSKAALKTVAEFSCVTGASVRVSKLNLMKKMIDAMAAKYTDGDFTELTDIYIPSGRQQWEGDVGRPWDEFGVFNRALRLIYWRAFAATAAGNNVVLKVASVGRVTVTGGNVKCTGTKTDLDTDIGVTVSVMKKNTTYPGEVKDGTTWVTVPKSVPLAYLTDLFETATKAKAGGSAGGADDVTVAKLLGMTTRAALDSAMIGYTDAQYASLADLTQALYRIYRFEVVQSHHKLSPARKRDPGVHFDWDKLIGHANLADVRKVAGLGWDPAATTRSPKGLAERDDTGKWGS